jgi:hypothetical protein
MIVGIIEEMKIGASPRALRMRPPPYVEATPENIFCASAQPRNDANNVLGKQKTHRMKFIFLPGMLLPNTEVLFTATGVELLLSRTSRGAKAINGWDSMREFSA